MLIAPLLEIPFLRSKSESLEAHGAYLLIVPDMDSHGTTIGSENPA